MWCLIKHLILRLQHCKFFTSYERVRPWLNIHSLTTRKELLLVCHKINCHLQQGKLWICVYDWLLTYLGYFYISVIYMLLCLRISPARKWVSKAMAFILSHFLPLCITKCYLGLREMMQWQERKTTEVEVISSTQ